MRSTSRLIILLTFISHAWVYGLPTTGPHIRPSNHQSRAFIRSSSPALNKRLLGAEDAISTGHTIIDLHPLNEIHLPLRSSASKPIDETLNPTSILGSPKRTEGSSLETQVLDSSHELIPSDQNRMKDFKDLEFEIMSRRPAIKPWMIKDWNSNALDLQEMEKLFIDLDLETHNILEIDFDGIRSIHQANVRLFDFDGPLKNPKMLEWYLNRFDTRDLQILEKEKLYQNLRYYLSRTWSSDEFNQIGTGESDWVIQHYHQDWIQKGFDGSMMIKLGQHLGIGQDQVRFTSQESYKTLQNFLNQGYARQWMDEMLDWYKQANLASLSSSDQRILTFNLNFVRQRPWWSENQLNRWREINLPLELAARVGTLLRFETKSSLRFNPKEIIKIREDLSVLMISYRNELLNRFTDQSGSTYRGILAGELSHATQIEERASRSLFDERIESIGLVDEEKQHLAQLIKSGHFLDILRDPPRLHQLYLEWSLDGINPERGFQLGLQIQNILSRSDSRLLGFEKVSTLDQLQTLLPTWLGVHDQHRITDLILIQSYETILGKTYLRVMIAKNVMMIRPLNRILTISKPIWNQFKPMVKWLRKL